MPFFLVVSNIFCNFADEIKKLSALLVALGIARTSFGSALADRRVADEKERVVSFGSGLRWWNGIHGRLKIFWALRPCGFESRSQHNQSGDQEIRRSGD